MYITAKSNMLLNFTTYDLEIFRFTTYIRLNHLIDWSVHNALAAGLSGTLCICYLDFENMSKVQRVDYDSYICCVKWNNAGISILSFFNYSRYLVTTSKVTKTENSNKLLFCSTGTEVSISGMGGTTSLYDSITMKILWKRKCLCHKSIPSEDRCRVVCAIWTREDQQIVRLVV